MDVGAIDISTNDQIESLVKGADGSLVVVFKKQESSETLAGVWLANFEVKSVDKTTVEKIAWSEGSDPSGLEIIVKEKDDVLANVGNSTNKTVNDISFKDFVSVTDGQVVLDDKILGERISYTLAVDTKDNLTDYVVVDTLPEYLVFSDSDVKASLTTWDKTGFNQVKMPSYTGFTQGKVGNELTLTVPSITALAQLRFTVEAQIDATKLDELRDAIQVKYDALDKNNHGDYFVTLTNTALFPGEDSKTAPVNVGGYHEGLEGPNVGNMFGKSTVLANTIQDVVLDDTGKLVPALPVVYELKADLSGLQEGNFKQTITQDVIVTDTLPAGVSLVGAPVLKKMGPPEATIALNEVAGVPDNDFEYSLSGQTLTINLGQAKENYKITLNAQVDSAESKIAGESNAIRDRFAVNNKAVFTLTTNETTNTEKWANFKLEHALNPDIKEPIEIAEAFSKTAPSAPIKAHPGGVVNVDFKFLANDVNLAESTITDYIDTKVFGKDYLGDVVIKGSVNGKTVNRNNFVLDKDANGNLTIVLKDKGAGFVNANGKDKLDITVTLPTLPIVGKGSVWVTNRADLTGEGLNYTLTSETSAVGTNRSAELEVRKNIWDGSEWAKNLRVADAANQEFYYRIQFLAHGAYAGSKIPLVTDQLPGSLEFLGFYSGVAGDNLGNTTNTPIGNLIAKYDADTNQIQINSLAGGISGDPKIELIFKVKVNSSEKNTPIVNKVGGSTTTIVPSDGFPLLVDKVDRLDANKYPIEDAGARFKLLASDKTSVLQEDIHIVDGQLLKRVGDTFEVITVPAVGTYYLQETVAPKGYELSTTLLEVSVDDRDPIGSAVFYNDHTPSYAIGDYTWIDKDSDGKQTSGDSVLPGVNVTIYNVVNGKPVETDVLDVKGNPIPRTQQTDSKGLYLFDNLPAGQYQVKFELTDPQKKVFSFTKQDEASDKTDKVDSDAHVGTGFTEIIDLGKDTSRLVEPSKYTAKTVVARDGVDPTWDAGVVYRSVSVGDYVWLDYDRDGKQDAGETPISGVVLKVYGPDGKTIAKDVFGNEVAPTQTDHDGLYTFDNLPVLDANQSYTVKIDQDDSRTKAALDGLMPTKAGEGSRDKDSSDWEAKSEGLTEDKQRDDTLDFGFFAKSYAVGDYVWIDTDRDGLQGEVAKEPVLDGVTVILKRVVGDATEDAYDVLGKKVEPAITKDGGRYLFENLPAGDYQVQFILTPKQAEIYTFTTLEKNVEGKVLNGSDSNAEVDGWTKSFTLDQSNTDRISAEVYGKPLKATEGIDPTWDAGVVLKTYAIGDYVWIDSTRDGIQGDVKDEPVLPSVSVTLYRVEAGKDPVKVTADITGKEFGDVVTDANGHYAFDNLPAGTYKVHFALTPEQANTYTFTKQVQDDDVTLDSDANPTVGSDKYGWSTEIVLNDSNTSRTKDSFLGDALKATQGIDPTWDAGVIYKKVSVGDYVWFDKNGNGIQDEEGTGINGVVLKLWKVVGDKVTPVEVDEKQLTQTTKEGGKYLFDNLPALLAGEKYRVTIDNEHESTKAALKPYVPTKPLEGDDRKVDSSKDSSDSIIDLVVDGTHDPSLDFGFHLKSVTVGDLVWVDENRDGRQGELEPGIENVLLKILGPDGKEVEKDVFGKDIERQRTDKNGEYLFPNLPVLEEGQSYTVVVVQEDEPTQKALKPYVPTKSNVPAESNEGNREGDSDTWSAKSEGLTENGQEDLTLDFGFIQKTYAVGDVVWIDTNRDGLQDADEAPLKGVVVSLTDKDGKPVKDIFDREVKSVKSDEEGRYIFDNLKAGSYKVHFALTEEQADVYAFTLQKEDDDARGDSDANAELGSEDYGWSTVIELNDDNKSLTKKYVPSENALQATEGIDPTWDAGVIVKKVSVGDFVWYDQNADGIQGEDKKIEPGIPGVVLKITKVDAEGVETEVTVDGESVPNQTTGEQGEYLFKDLPALKKGEKYRVTIVAEDPSTIKALEPYVPTDPVQGDDREKDSSQDSSDSIIDLVVDGTHDPSLDFGFKLKKVSVGDYVWVDKNRDGIQDEGEPGIPGVVLEVTDPEGNPVKDVFGKPVGPVTTGPNGEYTFENLPVLPEGKKYTVTINQKDKSTVEALKPYVPTVETEDGEKSGIDSSTWVAKSGDLTEDGDRDDTLDFGFVSKSYGIGDVTWIDSNNNGVQDKGEEPLVGVTVTLFSVDGSGKQTLVKTDINGDPVVPAVTNEQGWYMFDNLPAGNYQVQFTLTKDQATKYIFTSLKAGKDGAVDSNANPVSGLSDLIVLDDSNKALDKEYRNGDFGASEGIDPTWDAGVVVKTYAIGDLVWVDTNRDGLQGETEVLSGVKVTLLNDKGDVIATTETDKSGRYLFDKLPAGDYQVKFELTKQQAAKYRFTTVNTGKNAGADSDADTATGLTKVFKLDDNSVGLTKTYADQKFAASEGIDPTWDAGVVLKSVSVGDKVWEDKNKDGRQDPKEPGIPGVVLEVTGPDGKPVVDIFGKPVVPVTTDKDGKYLFPNLPVLEPGKCYTVSIDKDASKKALEKFLPTKAGQGDREGDSSTWTVCSEGLTQDGDADLTLDFGFIMNPKFMANTGTNLLVPAAAVTLLLGGGAYLVLRNQKTGRRRA